MLKQEYQNIFSLQGTHWWYRSINGLILRFIPDFLNFREGEYLLDAGCGTGLTQALLKGKFPGLKIVGMDVCADALNFCKKQGCGRLLQGEIEQIPLADNSIDLVVCLDVVYHSEVKDDCGALKELYRILKKGGYLFIHLPAFEILRRGHDRVVYTKRRYNANKLRFLLSSVGFRIVKQSYRNMFIFPLILLRKTIESLGRQSSLKSDLRPLVRWLNESLYAVSSLENKLIRRVNLPFGSSLFAIAKKEL